MYKILLILIIVLASNTIFSKEIVVFAIDLIRHGDRTPELEIPNDPHKWGEGLGQLTQIGIQQEINLGKSLRNLYINRYKLLPKKFDDKYIYIRSSDYNRTIMSAKAVISGLYLFNVKKTPAVLSQHLKVHIVPQQEEHLLLPGRNQPKAQALIKKYVTYTSAWQYKTAQYQNKFQFWSDISGFPIIKLKQVVLLADALYIRMLHNIPAPSQISYLEQNELISLANWVITTKFKSYPFSGYVTQELRATIAKYLQNAARGNSQLRYVLFSAHDATILAMMSALYNPLNEIPPYASDLKFLLTKMAKNTCDNNYYVKVIYNGKTVTLPSCRDNCTLPEFMKYLD